MPSIDRRTFLGTLSAGGALGLAGCSSSCPDSDSPEPAVVFGTGDAGSGFESLPGGSWPTPRFDARNTGHARSHRLPDSPSVRWRTTLPTPDVEGVDAGTSPPTVADGRVYLTTGRGAVALSLRDGTDRWRRAELGRPVGTDRVLAPPVVGEDAVFVATTDGLAALDPADGAVDWRYTSSAATGPPTVVGGGPVLPTDDGVVALAADGSERWSAPTGTASRPPLAATDGTVVVAGEAVTGLDAATGDRLWESSVRPESHPVVADGTVYLGTYEGLVGLRLDDGTERWTVDRGSGRAFSAPVVTDETVYAVERPGEAGDATFAFDRTGDGPPAPRWCSYVGEGAVAAAVDGHAVALQSGDEGDGAVPTRLVAFTRRFGEATWGFASAERALPPAVLDGGMVIANRLGTVAAVGGA
jgi:outer membrane protein assembly factor BamB